MTPLGPAWFAASPGTMNTAKLMVERYIHPYIWDPVMQWLLMQPTFIVLLVTSLLFWMIGYKRPLVAGRFSA